PARTIVDLAALASEDDLERALARADRARLLKLSDVAALVTRYRGRRGTRRLRALLAAIGTPAMTRSKAESRYLALVRRAQLPAPEVNARLADFEVDFLWRAQQLVVEIDGFAFHSSADAFERDRGRDAVLTAAGFRVMRVTWRQLTRTPEVVLVRVAQALVHR
ncbi:MAG TPA: DUF559 domain-containing protein, partial [Longimicrobiales bacterium]|nr:DUF559 domain-containing protein [Longimicrobiales bacterium]